MFKHSLVIATAALLLAPGCSKKDEGGSEASKSAKASPTSPALVKPAAAPYSPALAAKLTGDLASCTSQFGCKALDKLVGFGNKSSAGLLAIATDAAKPNKLRKVAIAGLLKLKDPTNGMKLLESAKSEKDFMTRKDLFDAAGASGGPATSDAMLAYYASDSSKDHRTDMLRGVTSLGKAKVFAYVVENFPADKKLQYKFAVLIRRTATDAAATAPLLAKAKGTMARHHIASAMVALGDVSKLEVLYAGLKAKDRYDRSDAMNMLANVVGSVPADKKAEVLALATTANKADKSGLTAGSYNRIKTKLGGK